MQLYRRILAPIVTNIQRGRYLERRRPECKLSSMQNVLPASCSECSQALKDVHNVHFQKIVQIYTMQCANVHSTILNLCTMCTMNCEQCAVLALCNLHNVQSTLLRLWKINTLCNVHNEHSTQCAKECDAKQDVEGTLPKLCRAQLLKVCWRLGGQLSQILLKLLSQRRPLCFKTDNRLHSGGLQLLTVTLLSFRTEAGEN